MALVAMQLQGNIEARTSTIDALAANLNALFRLTGSSSGSICASFVTDTTDASGTFFSYSGSSSSSLIFPLATATPRLLIARVKAKS
jgi:hypothetical protein